MAPPKYQVYSLHETYPELGEYAFKIVLNPRFFKNGHEVSVVLVDSDRKPMNYEVKTWGRKINVNFTIDKDTSDGVSIAKIFNGLQEIGRLTFWIIKP